jgi:two-component system KDP operon response regulator KdpE
MVARLLIVDDDADLVRLMTAQLRASGFEVIAAADGASAIMTAQRQKPDAIVLDIGLPGGDGYLVMRRLRALAPFAGVPIIVITGRTLSQEEEEQVKSQAQALMYKPVDFEKLVTTIRAALGEPGNPHPNAATTTPTL